jgi:hypothetical protein
MDYVAQYVAERAVDLVQATAGVGPVDAVPTRHSLRFEKAANKQLGLLFGEASAVGSSPGPEDRLDVDLLRPQYLANILRNLRLAAYRFGRNGDPYMKRSASSPHDLCGPLDEGRGTLAAPQRPLDALDIRRPVAREAHPVEPLRDPGSSISRHDAVGGNVAIQWDVAFGDDRFERVQRLPY